MIALYISMNANNNKHKGEQKMNNKLAKVIVKLKMIDEFDLANKIKKDHLANNISDEAIKTIILASKKLNN